MTCQTPLWRTCTHVTQALITVLLIDYNHEECLLHIGNEGDFVGSESNEKITNMLVKFGSLVYAIIQQQARRWRCVTDHTQLGGCLVTADHTVVKLDWLSFHQGKQAQWSPWQAVLGSYGCTPSKSLGHISAVGAISSHWGDSCQLGVHGTLSIEVTLCSTHASWKVMLPANSS